MKKETILSVLQALWKALPLSHEEVLVNEDLANRAPDSTRDNGTRPWAWNPPLVSREEYDAENPYARSRP